MWQRARGEVEGRAEGLVALVNTSADCSCGCRSAPWWAAAFCGQGDCPLTPPKHVLLACAYTASGLRSRDAISTLPHTAQPSAKLPLRWAVRPALK